MRPSRECASCGSPKEDLLHILCECPRWEELRKVHLHPVPSLTSQTLLFAEGTSSTPAQIWPWLQQAGTILLAWYEIAEKDMGAARMRRAASTQVQSRASRPVAGQQWQRNGHEITVIYDKNVCRLRCSRCMVQPKYGQSYRILERACPGRNEKGSLKLRHNFLDAHPQYTINEHDEHHFLSCRICGKTWKRDKYIQQGCRHALQCS